MAARKKGRQGGGARVTIINPDRGTSTRRAPATNGRGRGRGRGKSGGQGRGRGRTANGSTARSGGAQVVRLSQSQLRAALAAAPAKNGRKRGRGRKRNGRGFTRNPTFNQVINLAKQLAYSGIGAFALNVATQMVPLPATTSAPITLLFKAGVAWVLGWAGSKINREFGDLVRIGGFAVVAGDTVRVLWPNLDQQILSYSPFKSAKLSDVYEVPSNYPWMNAASTGPVGRLNDVYEMPVNQLGLAA